MYGVSSPVRSTRRAVVYTMVASARVPVTIPVPVTLCSSFSNAHISTVTYHRAFIFGTGTW